MTVTKFSEVCRQKLFVNIKTREQFLKLVEGKLGSKKSQKPQVYFYVYVGSIYFAFTDNAYFDALKNADCVYLDGFFLGWIIKLLYSMKITRFGAEDYFDDLFSFCQKHKKKVFLLGSDNTSKGARGAVKNIHEKFPNLAVRGHHGYFDNNRSIVREINNFRTDFLVVGLGLGYQEKWVNQNQKSLKNVRVILGVGNFIDIFGRKTELPPEILKKYNLRWLWRLAKEPARLWKRYFLGVVFLSILVIYTILAKLTNLILRKIKS